MNEWKNLEGIVSHIIGLRRKLEAAEAQLFIAMASVERDTAAMRIIMDEGGCDTFDQFIRSYEICKTERYRAFLRGMAHVESESEAKNMGAPAVIALAGVRDEANVTTFKQYVSDWRERHHGLTPRYETAARLLRQADPRPEVPKATKTARQQASELERLRAENKALKAENRALKRRLAKLEPEAA